MAVLLAPTDIVVSASADWLIDVYYVWFAIFALAAMVALGGLLTPSAGRTKREGYYLGFAINFIASLVRFQLCCFSAVSAPGADREGCCSC